MGKMTQGEFLERIGDALYGPQRPAGWMSRLAADLNISAGHLNNLHKGHRKMSPEILARVKGLLVRGSAEAMERGQRLAMLFQEVQDPYYDDLALKAEPETEPDNDGPAPQNM